MNKYHFIVQEHIFERNSIRSEPETFNKKFLPLMGVLSNLCICTINRFKIQLNFLTLGEAMFMKLSDENSCSWNLCTTFVKAALTGLSLHYEAICWAYTMAIRKLTRSAIDIFIIFWYSQPTSFLGFHYAYQNLKSLLETSRKYYFFKTWIQCSTSNRVSFFRQKTVWRSTNS